MLIHEYSKMPRQLLAILSLLLISAITHSEETEEPSWELGLGLGIANFPHYPGSDQSKTIVAPLPYPKYNSKRLQLDEDGLAAKLHSSDRVKLSLSLNGSFPADSDSNRAREGMRDLELIGELGPELEITLKRWKKAELRLDLPVRAAFEITLEHTPKQAGWNFEPRLHYEKEIDHWDVEFDLGALFGNRRYHQTFYEVDAADLTATRPAYQANSGLTGWRLSSTVKRRWGNWLLLGYVRYMNFSSAANEGSPLLVSTNYLAGGVGLIWVFKSSR